MAEAIKIDGLAEFVRNLRKLDDGLPKALRLTLNEAAGVIVDYARAHVAVRTGRARGTIRATSTRQAARVSGGGKRAPYYPWLDFGGRVGPGRSVARPFYTDGRYIYAGYYAKRDQFEQMLVDGLVDTARAAGIEVD